MTVANNHIHVLMLCSSYPRFDDDNSSIFLEHLCESLSKHGIKISVLAPDDTLVTPRRNLTNVKTYHFRYFPSRFQLLAYGSGIIPNLRRNPLLWIQVPFFVLSMFIKLIQLAKKTNADIIHAHWIVPQGTIAVLVGKLLGIPVVTTAHGGDAFAFHGRLLSFVKLFTISKSAACTSNTPSTAIAASNASLDSKFKIIPMGVDIACFSSGNCPANLLYKSNNKIIILFIGRLVEKKGVTCLIEAFSLLNEPLRSKTQLWIIGDGIEKNKLESQCNSLNVESHIQFFGQVPNLQLPDYLACSSIFVVPSIEDTVGDTEGQGVVILEAMASGTPVIASNVGGIRYVIQDEVTGILVTPNKPLLLSQAIERLLLDESLQKRLSSNARANVDERYSWDLVASNFIDVYKSAARKST